MERFIMSDKTDKIQLTTYNQFGEFSFYVERKQIQHYLESKLSKIEVDQFLEICTIKDTRILFDWIKNESLKMATELKQVEKSEEES
jgi:hypothetical protein